MKKLLVLSLAVLFAAPVFAKEGCGCEKKGQCPAGAECKAAPAKPGAFKMNAEQKERMEAFKKAHEEHKAKMKATEEKMEKLVKEYNKLKAGKKKDAKKAEIAAVVASIHEEQLKFKTEQLAKFQERLAQMQQELDAEKTDEAKQEWVNAKTDAVIADEGDLDVLFEGPKGDMNKGPFGPRGNHKPGNMKRGEKGPRPHGPKGPKGPQGEEAKQLPPPMENTPAN